MDVKNKIQKFIEQGNKICDLSNSQVECEQWLQEIKTFSERHLQGHPLQREIFNNVFFRESPQKMMATLQALYADEDILYEQRTIGIKKRNTISQKDNGKLKVLFFASNPKGVRQLSLDEEARMIEESIRKSEYRDRVQFVSKWATQTTDILQGINELNPDIVHFSSHGTENNELVMQNSDGTPKVISKEAVSAVISTVSDKVKLVFFNSCFSSGQAEEVIKCIDSAIGMVNPISDKAACVFATQFYSSLVFGHSLEKAFSQAKAMLMLEGISEEDTPQLCIKEGLNPSTLIFVKE